MKHHIINILPRLIANIKRLRKFLRSLSSNVFLYDVKAWPQSVHNVYIARTRTHTYGVFNIVSIEASAACANRTKTFKWKKGGHFSDLPVPFCSTAGIRCEQLNSLWRRACKGGYLFAFDSSLGHVYKPMFPELRLADRWVCHSTVFSRFECCFATVTSG